MKTLDEIFKLEPGEFDAHWREIDEVVGRLPSVQDQENAWKGIITRLGSASASKAHPYLRLAIIRLLADADESEAISLLEMAYEEDRHKQKVRFPPTGGHHTDCLH